jgi:hypothetical protein
MVHELIDITGADLQARHHVIAFVQILQHIYIDGVTPLNIANTITFC